METITPEKYTCIITTTPERGRQLFEDGNHILNIIHVVGLMWVMGIVRKPICEHRAIKEDRPANLEMRWNHQTGTWECPHCLEKERGIK